MLLIESALIRPGSQRLRNVFSAIGSAYFDGSLREMKRPATRDGPNALIEDEVLCWLAGVSRC